VGAAKYGDEFVKHAFDEATAIQEGIVEAETELARSHPFPEGRDSEGFGCCRR
jgi:hypothetical protein